MVSGPSTSRILVMVSRSQPQTVAPLQLQSIEWNATSSRFSLLGTRPVSITAAPMRTVHLLELRLNWLDTVRALILESVTNLAVDLARVVVVEAAEGEAVVKQDSVIANVEGSDGQGYSFAEILCGGEVKRRVGRQIGCGVRGRGIRLSVGKSRSVINVC